MKTRDFSRLRHGRERNFLIGLILALSAVIAAFNWTVTGSEFSYETKAIQEEEIPVVRTVQKKERRVPPSGVLVSKNDFYEDPVFTPEPLPSKLFMKSPDPSPTGEPGPVFDPEPYRPVVDPPPPPRQQEIEAPLLVVEVMPRFPGCEEGEMSREEREQCATLQLLRFIQSNLRYPEIARENRVEGLVVVSFIVEKDGSVTDVQVLRDIGGGCGQEAVRVIKLMPDWRPGMQQGRKVRVQYRMPVKFQLQ